MGTSSFRHCHGIRDWHTNLAIQSKSKAVGTIQPYLASSENPRRRIHQLRLIGRTAGAFGTLWEQIEKQAKENLETLVPRMDQHQDKIDELYEIWNDPNYSPSLSEIEKGFRDMEVIRSDAQDRAELIRWAGIL